jgi:hypothetical protein
MEKISVKKVSNTEFDVTVESRITTIHRVSLPELYYYKLTRGTVTQESLLEKSFEFLLQREPNTSILRSFKLSVIGKYFPEYESAIKNML